VPLENYGKVQNDDERQGERADHTNIKEKKAVPWLDPDYTVTPEMAFPTRGLAARARNASALTGRQLQNSTKRVQPASGNLPLGTFFCLPQVSLPFSTFRSSCAAYARCKYIAGPSHPQPLKLLQSTLASIIAV